MLLVTGATSNSGRFFFKELEKCNFQKKIRCLVRKDSDVSFLKKISLNVEFFYGDFELEEEIDFAKLLNKVDTIIHIATILYCEKIFEESKKKGINWLICLSSTGVFSKLKKDESLEFKKIEKKISYKYKNLTIVRSTMIYGGVGENIVSKIIFFMRNFFIFPVFGSGKNLIQPVNAQDLGKAYALIIFNKKKTFGKKYNLSGKDKISYIQLLKLISKKLNKKVFLIKIPLWICFTMVFLVRIFNKNIITIDQIRGMNEDKIFSNKKARNDFGYDPISLDKGLDLLIKGKN